MSRKTTEVKVGSDDQPKPLCPHCGKELPVLVRHRSGYNLIRHLDVLSCPHCRKVVGTLLTFK
jgi:hypothetical protein